MKISALDARSSFLGPEAGVPLDRPFTTAQAKALGVTGRTLGGWVRSGLVRSPVRGIHHVAQLDDGLELRAACLRLGAPDDAVFTDHTAAWLHGAPMVLPPNAHLTIPPVSMHLPPGGRLRNGVTESGERDLRPEEVVDLGGLRVTSPLRTMCDLGRRRDASQAFAALCAMANLPGVDLDAFRRYADSPRFHGHRWVRTLRAWAPHVVAGTQSPGECALLRHWIDCSDLPYPQIQVPVQGPLNQYYLDVGDPELRYAAEYDGPRWHGAEHRAHDEARRTWIVEERGWIVDVFTAADVYGQQQPVTTRLRSGIAEARRRYGARAWHGQDRPSASPRTGSTAVHRASGHRLHVVT